MVACLFFCHVIDMNRLSPVTGKLPCLCSYKLNRETKLLGFGLGFQLQGKERLKRKLNFVVTAELLKAFFPQLGCIQMCVACCSHPAVHSLSFRSVTLPDSARLELNRMLEVMLGFRLMEREGETFKRRFCSYTYEPAPTANSQQI